MKAILLPVVFAVFAAMAFGAPDAAKGKELFLKKCKTCHGEDGSGTPAMLKKFGAKLKPLHGKEVQAMKDEALVKSLSASANHKALLKTMQPGDLENSIAHIRTLKK
jgi:cytochrome c